MISDSASSKEVLGSPDKFSSPLIVQHPLEQYGNDELPIAKHRQEIIDTVLNNPVTIIESPTGSGKTTQVPQYFLGLRVNGRPAFDRILMTQPRIVTARETSSRLNTELLSVSDYYIAGYNTSIESSDIRQSNQDIAVLTTGKLYAQRSGDINNSKKNKEKKLIIIDEVHLWDLPTEELVALSHSMTDPKSAYYDPNLTVVIMSATLDSNKLQSYFSHRQPPKIKVEVPVSVEKRISKKDAATTAFELVQETNGVILVFVAGKSEIDFVSESLIKLQEIEKIKSGRDPVPVIPLHAQLSREEQSLAFRNYENGAIIITTNVAETSLTIPSAKAVVDTGEARFSEIRYDLLGGKGSGSLNLKQIAQSSADQRLGRVGRTSPGIYVTCNLKSATKKQPMKVKSGRSKYETPAILCEPLDGMMLKQKASGVEISDLKFFHEPPANAIQDALNNLYGLGAIDSDGKITERGAFMDKLPLDPSYSCMIAHALEQRYSDSAVRNIIDIVSVMQVGGVLQRGPRLQEWRKILLKDDIDDIAEKDSDFFAQLEAYHGSLKMDSYSRERYDLIDNNIQRVQPVRERLYRSLGLQIKDVEAIKKEDRPTLLNAINIGQINQIWITHGEQWELLAGAVDRYNLSESSIVCAIGKVVTAELFTLGGKDAIEHTALQNVNVVPDVAQLVKYAPHIAQEKVGDFVYDPESNKLVGWARKSVGSFVLSEYRKSTDEFELKDIPMEVQAAVVDKIINKWKDRQEKLIDYNKDNIDEALDEPRRTIVGTNPYTNEPIYVWLGGNGSWVNSREIAVKSLEASKKRMSTKEQKFSEKPDKVKVSKMEAELMRTVNDPRAPKSKKLEARALLNGRKARTRNWYDQARTIADE